MRHRLKGGWKPWTHVIDNGSKGEDVTPWLSGAFMQSRTNFST